MSRGSKHQDRVLLALLALSDAHKWSWWTRDAIGYVVGAGWSGVRVPVSGGG